METFPTAGVDVMGYDMELLDHSRYAACTAVLKICGKFNTSNNKT